MWWLNKLFCLVALGVSSLSMGAACCGTGGLFPSLITGDDRRQLTATASVGSIVGDALTDGTWERRSAGDSESRSTLRIDYASLLSDRWQWGLSLPVVTRSRSRPSASASALGFGDVQVTLGFEALPQWSYSPWRPKGTVFVALTAPTGRSPFDSQTTYKVDAMGRGYWTVTVGGLLQKTWGNWDAMLLLEAHRPFPRTLSTPAGSIGMSPDPGVSSALGVGRSWGDFRLGALITASVEGPLRTSGAIVGVGSKVVSFPATLQLSYMLSDLWSLSGLYTDATWFGSSNLPLARTVGVTLQTRWDR